MLTIKKGINNAKNIKTFGLLMAFNVWEEDGKLCFEDKEDSMNTIRFAKRLLKEKKLNLISINFLKLRDELIRYFN